MGCSGDEEVRECGGRVVGGAGGNGVCGGREMR